MKICKIIAGPNGSGKSAYFKHARENALLTGDDGPYLCGDDVVLQLKKLGVNLDENALNFEAQQIIFKKRREFMLKGISFVYETVCSHPSHLDFYRELKERGYKIILIYIATDNADINVSRVAKRVECGGHDVPVDKIRARYNRCLQIYPQLFNLSDEAHVYDNSLQLDLCMKKTIDGRIEVYSISHKWAIENIIAISK